MEALSTTKAAYITLTEAAKEAIWLKGLVIESGFELNIVAGVATCALSKAVPRSKISNMILRSSSRRLTTTRVAVWVSINSNKEADEIDFQGFWKLVSVQVLRQEKGSKVRMKALLEQQRLAAALEELPAATIVAYDSVIQKKAYIILILCLGDWVLREITKETAAAGI
ncbi:hypothetical protein Tco_0697686 [Tanacetum coccineum]